MLCFFHMSTFSTPSVRADSSSFPDQKSSVPVHTHTLRDRCKQQYSRSIYSCTWCPDCFPEAWRRDSLHYPSRQFAPALNPEPLPASHTYIIKIKIHSSCEIEFFVETHLCKLCVILRSRVLRAGCPHKGYRSATPLATTV